MEWIQLNAVVNLHDSIVVSVLITQQISVQSYKLTVIVLDSMLHAVKSFVVCPAEGQERSRRSAGNTKKRKTCSQQKDTRIKRFWSKHFRQRHKTIFTEYDRKKNQGFLL